ncbi:hypothetical protein [Azonexus sp. R2A61]|uniref:hypothetical protein n=1 Tax=Azonexus sp. R2A61 TaxID=2744443 RepID=UPI001F28A821|nr:hypothetical protein [Azonexus sp. R2A61]
MSKAVEIQKQKEELQKQLASLEIEQAKIIEAEQDKWIADHKQEMEALGLYAMKKGGAKKKK